MDFPTAIVYYLMRAQLKISLKLSSVINQHDKSIGVNCVVGQLESARFYNAEN